jgi:hypothetical protein
MTTEKKKEVSFIASVISELELIKEKAKPRKKYCVVYK